MLVEYIRIRVSASVDHEITGVDIVIIVCAASFIGP